MVGVLFGLGLGLIEFVCLFGCVVDLVGLGWGVLIGFGVVLIYVVWLVLCFVVLIGLVVGYLDVCCDWVGCFVCFGFLG